jgi:hypothetical protein
MFLDIVLIRSHLFQWLESFPPDQDREPPKDPSHRPDQIPAEELLSLEHLPECGIPFVLFILRQAISRSNFEGSALFAPPDENQFSLNLPSKSVDSSERVRKDRKKKLRFPKKELQPLSLRVEQEV